MILELPLFITIISILILIIITCIIISLSLLYKEYKHTYLKDKIYPYLEKISTENPSLKSLEILDKMLIKAIKYDNLSREKYTKIVNTMNGYFMNNKEVLKDKNSFIKAYNSFLDDVKNILKK